MEPTQAQALWSQLDRLAQSDSKAYETLIRQVRQHAHTERQRSVDWIAAVVYTVAETPRPVNSAPLPPSKTTPTPPPARPTRCILQVGAHASVPPPADAADVPMVLLDRMPPTAPARACAMLNDGRAAWLIDALVPVAVARRAQQSSGYLADLLALVARSARAEFAIAIDPDAEAAVRLAQDDYVPLPDAMNPAMHAAAAAAEVSYKAAPEPEAETRPLTMPLTVPSSASATASASGPERPLIQVMDPASCGPKPAPSAAGTSDASSPMALTHESTASAVLFTLTVPRGTALPQLDIGVADRSLVVVFTDTATGRRTTIQRPIPARVIDTQHYTAAFSKKHARCRISFPIASR
ncbi:hypothetical protein CXG81DRAFT_20484 [Caulochytrium protostelioides]|uniref:Uncharacterized protein n=1 Tax=Caulochytrium protostelioides TaxID=1555241 RepID=A0A4P9X339_9FUNG|nr:hypothetical protein CXG81DRAFT_20484 [Caulochytrium protostelioides]|eukprot:RKO99421.1 hypothetical protein CXG81DRAFT_20484 [Caulochytrium protostelioides]